MGGFYIYGGGLYHYGKPRRSGRYEWGTGERPYQSLEKPKKTFRQKRKEKKIAKKRMEASRRKAEQRANEKLAELRRAEKNAKWDEEQKRLENEMYKERLLREGKASGVQKYKSVLSNDELQKIVRRIELNETIDKYAQKEIDDIWSKISNATNKLDKLNKFTSAIVSAGQNANDIYKLIDGYQKKPKTK